MRTLCRVPCSPLAESLGLSADLRFRGFLTQAELRPLVEAADIMVMSSRHEAGPLAMLEAAAAGCTDRRGPRSVILQNGHPKLRSLCRWATRSRLLERWVNSFVTKISDSSLRQRPQSAQSRKTLTTPVVDSKPCMGLLSNNAASAIAPAPIGSGAEIRVVPDARSASAMPDGFATYTPRGFAPRLALLWSSFCAKRARWRQAQRARHVYKHFARRTCPFNARKSCDPQVRERHVSQRAATGRSLKQPAAAK